MQFNQAPAPRESSLGDAYDPTASYSVDDLCIHDNVLQKCIVPISGGEAWNPAHWTETNIGDEIKALNSKIAKVQFASWTASSNPGFKNAVTNPVTFRAGKKYVVTIILPNVTPAGTSDNWLNMRDNNDNVINGSYIGIRWGSYKSKTFYYEATATFDCPVRSEQTDAWTANYLAYGGGLIAIELD